MGMQRDDFGRKYIIHICKDGTISYRTAKEKVFNGRALPVFTVDTEQQAQDVQVRFGVKQYVEHPKMPGKAWYRWTGFSGNAEDLDNVSDAIREFYKIMTKAAA